MRGVVVDDVDVAVLRVDVDPAVVLRHRVQATDDPFRIRDRGGIRRVRQPVVDQNTEPVLIVEDDFVVDRIDGDPAEVGVRILDESQRGTRGDIGRRREPRGGRCAGQLQGGHRGRER